MVMKVFLDLESIPPEKDDPLVCTLIAQCTEEEFRNLALDCNYGRLLCIGLIIEHDDQIIHRGVLGRDRSTMRFHLDEARLLRAFWNLVKNFDPRYDLLIGFNLLDFDLHFLTTRSIIKFVKPSIDISFARYRSKPVYDLMWEYTHWRHRIKLDEVAKVLGLKSSKQDGVDGSKVWELFIQGRHQEIADYCMADTECARAIYRRIRFINEVETARARYQSSISK